MTAKGILRATLRFTAGGVIGGVVGLLAGIMLFMFGNDGSPPNPLLAASAAPTAAQVRTAERSGVHIWQRCLDTCDEFRP